MPMIVGRMLVEAALSVGAEHAVVSSGSRSMPLATAFWRDARFDTLMVVDERVAAFVALGMARATGKPTVLVATSGSALLNYTPALAEAYYAAIPLIVITADRPAQWIDQNDGQTMRQAGALAHVVKKSVDIDGDATDRLQTRYALRLISEAVDAAVSAKTGPVHINVHLGEPLSPTDPLTSDSSETIDYKPVEIARCADKFVGSCEVLPPAGAKLMVYVGARQSDDRLSRALDYLAAQHKAVVVCDDVSGVRGDFVYDIDSVLCGHLPTSLAPDHLITVGGTPVSRAFKQWLRTINGLNHWSVSDDGSIEDTYLSLRKVITANPVDYFNYLGASDLKTDVTFVDGWMAAKSRAEAAAATLLAAEPWGDLKAADIIINALPYNYRLHLSNGMTVRNVNKTNYRRFREVSGSRGVNGIDGCTSTAIGISLVSEEPVALLTGDMSALYDIASLQAGLLTPRFKMIVFDNGGGEIFRRIDATRSLPEREPLLAAMPQVDWRRQAESASMLYLEADSPETLTTELSCLIAETGRPVMLRVMTR